ncbi:hypothetical protein M433DRAFT_60599 [Acidomyces richmondensis BFW]|nr:MAG: hypothetical protein FE78DRAFT_203611 [Acidomyces sp. 'richmondensis']KYG48723.1 hypothetical protein M433DRAFT_60599 [Acidomyces richmondensis BFW]
MANMFATLNRFIARLDSDPQSQSAHTSRAQSYGFQVLRNQNSQLALEPWFDFIIGINGRNIDSPDPNLFATEVRNCAGGSISLGIFSAKGQVVRELYAAVPKDTASLGVALQWCPLNLTEDVWHILDVMPNSPADVAGLLPYGDYVIGSPDGVLRGEAGLGELVEHLMEQPLRLWVYNHEYDVTRMITITPSKSWGGEGALGCVLGYGALHRVPAPLHEPAQAPGEVLFESAPESRTQPSVDSTRPSAANFETAGQSGFLVPANMPGLAAPSPPPASGGPPLGHVRAKKARAPVSGLDDYFAEGEQKSREIDKPTTPKAAANLPPPPRGGAPPKANSQAPSAGS